MELYLFSPGMLPKGFQYPRTFLEYISRRQIAYLGPWWFLCEFQELSDYWLKQLKKQYPDRELIPFAKCFISDDVACFDGTGISSDPKIHCVHCFTSSGWEDRGNVINFSTWLQQIETESALYKAQSDEHDI